MTRIATLALTTLLAQLTFAQAPGTPTQTFRFANAPSEKEMQEIATTIRSVADIRQVSLDTAQRTLLVGGTPAQIALADWLFSSFDKPTDVPPDSATHQYQPFNDPDELVRVFYLKNPSSVQQTQEIATLLRSTGDIRRLFTYNALKALAVRGTSTQIALTEWLVNELDQPVDAPSATQQSRAKAIHVYRPSGTDDDVVRVFYLPETARVPDFQKIVTYVRTTAGLRRSFTYNDLRAVAVRGTEEQVTLAESLFKEKGPVTVQAHP